MQAAHKAGLLVIAIGLSAFAQSPTPKTTTLPPIDAAARVKWLASQNLAPTAILEDIAISAILTGTNTPEEYGPHWEGFGKRVGLAAADFGVLTVMEAGLGSLWGEDPRYERTVGQSFKSRLGHVIKMTFMANNKDGSLRPAYARYLALSGGSFLENAWTPDSQSSTGDAIQRAGYSFLSRMGGNAFKEFRPRHK
jgi:hypothetical protein